MDITLDMIGGLKPQMARELIPLWLSGFMELDAAAAPDAMAGITAAIDGFDDLEIAGALESLGSLGDEYALYRADPVAQRVTRAFMRTLMEGSEVTGIAHLRHAQEEGPTLVVCNHLAYCDTQIKDLLLADNGASDLAKRLIAVAGPKVYETPFRRMASMALNTLKTAQSSVLESNAVQLSPREVAVIAIGTVHAAHARMVDGDIVLLYGEGSRSRTRRLGSFIKAVRKYAQVDGCRIVPMAITGSDKMMPLESLTMRPVPVQLKIGPSIRVADFGALGALENAWHAVAGMLPIDQQPELSTPPVI
jgi:hypothetical protein